MENPVDENYGFYFTMKCPAILLFLNTAAVHAIWSNVPTEWFFKGALWQNGEKKKPYVGNMLSSQSSDSHGDQFISDIFAGYWSNSILMEKQQQYNDIPTADLSLCKRKPQHGQLNNF